MLLQVSHGTIDTKVREILRGIEPVIKIPDHYFEILENTIEALCTNIEKDGNIHQSLQKIANITYIMTGNGYYLFQKVYALLN